jgi:hypothetical protein
VLDARAGGADDRELGGDEQPVQDHEHEDDDDGDRDLHHASS